MSDRFAWLDDLPLPLGAPHLRMGLRGLDPADWLPSDELTLGELVAKRELLDQHDDLAAAKSGPRLRRAEGGEQSPDDREPHAAEQ